MATTRLYDEIACDGCSDGTAKTDDCGCVGKKVSSPNIIVNVGSNNRDGYNNLNPGQIERDRMFYPMQQQVVQPNIVQPNVVNPTVLSTPVVTTSGQVITTQGVNRVLPNTTPLNYTTRQTKQRIFYPEFL